MTISTSSDISIYFFSFNFLGDRAVDEEGVHSGVFPGPKVHVCVLHACQARLPEQDVCKSMSQLSSSLCLPTTLPIKL